jgi:hypothetical protein
VEIGFQIIPIQSEAKQGFLCQIGICFSDQLAQQGFQLFLTDHKTLTGQLNDQFLVYQPIDEEPLPFLFSRFFPILKKAERLDDADIRQRDDLIIDDSHDPVDNFSPGGYAKNQE